MSEDDARMIVGVPFAVSASQFVGGGFTPAQTASFNAIEAHSGAVLDDAIYFPIAAITMKDAVPAVPMANGTTSRDAFKADCDARAQQRIGQPLPAGFLDARWDSTLGEVVQDLVS